MAFVAGGDGDIVVASMPTHKAFGGRHQSRRSVRQDDTRLTPRQRACATHGGGVAVCRSRDAGSPRRFRRSRKVRFRPRALRSRSKQCRCKPTVFEKLRAPHVPAS